MTQQSLGGVIPQGDRLLLDTSVLIAYLGGQEAVSPVATHLIDSYVRSGRNSAIISMVSVMETVVRPLRHGGDPYVQVVDFLTTFPNLQPMPIEFPVAHEAARFRAAHNLAAPDALIIATGITGRVSHLVTNDRAWGRKLRTISGQIAVCYLGDHLPFP